MNRNLFARCPVGVLGVVAFSLSLAATAPAFAPPDFTGTLVVVEQRIKL